MTGYIFFPFVTSALIARLYNAQRGNRDPGTRWHAACAYLARDAKAPIIDVLDEWDERAAIAEFVGNLPRAESEAQAFAETQARFMLRGA